MATQTPVLKQVSLDDKYALDTARAGVAVLQLVVTLATMLKGTGAMITAVSGGAIGEVTAIVTIIVLFTLYGVAGGLTAAIITDFVQGIMTVVLSFLLLPFALGAVGGLSGLRETIADPEMFALLVIVGLRSPC